MSILENNTEKLNELKEKANSLPDYPPPAKLQEKTVTPTKEGLSVVSDEGYDGLFQVTVNGDSNLISENIKSGVSIFGVNGDIQEGVKRLIPTQLKVTYSDPVSITGSGILYTDNNSFTVDGSRHTITYENNSDWLFYIGSYAFCKIKFNNSATVNENDIALIGKESDYSLTGYPTKIIRGRPSESTPITANGKGFVIINSEDGARYDYSNMGIVTIDGVKINQNNIDVAVGYSFRLDFDKSIKIEYGSAGSYNQDVGYQIFIY